MTVIRVEEGSPKVINLSDGEADCLVNLAATEGGRLSFQDGEVDVRILKSLENKSLCAAIDRGKEVLGWEITDLGRKAIAIFMENKTFIDFRGPALSFTALAVKVDQLMGVIAAIKASERSACVKFGWYMLVHLACIAVLWIWVPPSFTSLLLIGVLSIGLVVIPVAFTLIPKSMTVKLREATYGRFDMRFDDWFFDSNRDDLLNPISGAKDLQFLKEAMDHPVSKQFEPYIYGAIKERPITLCELALFRRELLAARSEVDMINQEAQDRADCQALWDQLRDRAAAMPPLIN